MKSWQRFLISKSHTEKKTRENMFPRTKKKLITNYNLHQTNGKLPPWTPTKNHGPGAQVG